MAAGGSDRGTGLADLEALVQPLADAAGIALDGAAADLGADAEMDMGDAAMDMDMGDEEGAEDLEAGAGEDGLRSTSQCVVQAEQMVSSILRDRQ